MFRLLQCMIHSISTCFAKLLEVHTKSKQHQKICSPRNSSLLHATAHYWNPWTKLTLDYWDPTWSRLHRPKYAPQKRRRVSMKNSSITYGQSGWLTWRDGSEVKSSSLSQATRTRLVKLREIAYWGFRLSRRVSRCICSRKKCGKEPARITSGTCEVSFDIQSFQEQSLRV